MLNIYKIFLNTCKNETVFVNQKLKLELNKIQINMEIVGSKLEGPKKK